MFSSGKKWPPILDTDDLPKKCLPSIYKAPTPEMITYLDFSVSTAGMLAGIKLSHGAATSLCLSMKVCHVLVGHIFTFFRKAKGAWRRMKFNWTEGLNKGVSKVLEVKEQGGTCSSWFELHIFKFNKHKQEIVYK